MSAPPSGALAGAGGPPGAGAGGPPSPEQIAMYKGQFYSSHVHRKFKWAKLELMGRRDGHQKAFRK